MNQVEYRVEGIPAHGHVVDVFQRRDQLAHDGWRASSVQDEVCGLAPTQVLHERDRSSSEAFRRLFAPRALFLPGSPTS